MVGLGICFGWWVSRVCSLVIGVVVGSLLLIRGYGVVGSVICLY